MTTVTERSDHSIYQTWQIERHVSHSSTITNTWACESGQMHTHVSHDTLIFMYAYSCESWHMLKGARYDKCTVAISPIVHLQSQYRQLSIYSRNIANCPSTTCQYTSIAQIMPIDMFVDGQSAICRILGGQISVMWCVVCAIPESFVGDILALHGPPHTYIFTCFQNLPKYSATDCNLKNFWENGKQKLTDQELRVPTTFCTGCQTEQQTPRSIHQSHRAVPCIRERVSNREASRAIVRHR